MVLIGGDGQHLDVGGETMPGPVAVRRRHGRWVIDGRHLPADVSKSKALDVRSGSPLTVSGEANRTYPGTIRCVADREGDAFDVLNVLPMEAYIPGVLAGELFEGWHDAAFEAQAIAARSYAVSECHERQNRTWDVTDTPASQHYIGVPTWSQAVTTAKATEGQLLVWNGSVVPGYFSSCCGGRAATASDAVGPNPVNAVPPLDGHSDPPHCSNAPRYTWEATWDATRVAEALRAHGSRIGDHDLAGIKRVTSIRSMKPNRHGRPTLLQIQDGSRTVTMRCVDFPGSVASSGIEPVASGWIDAVERDGELHVRGHGFGHGVGLCQYGAEELASSSSTPHDILQFYYPGAEIRKAW
jgi:stage II sporulation protein D